MAQAFPHSRFTGYDFSEEGVATARAEARSMQLSNVQFVVQDVALIDAASQYDLITAFDAIHDQVYPTRVLRGIAGALRPAGVFLMADIRASSDLAENISLPLAPFMYTISCMHCMTVSLAHGGEGLGTVIGESGARTLARDAGFSRFERAAIDDPFNQLFVLEK